MTTLILDGQEFSKFEDGSKLVKRIYEPSKSKMIDPVNVFESDRTEEISELKPYDPVVVGIDYSGSIADYDVNSMYWHQPMGIIKNKFIKNLEYGMPEVEKLITQYGPDVEEFIMQEMQEKQEYLKSRTEILNKIIESNKTKILDEEASSFFVEVPIDTETEDAGTVGYMVTSIVEDIVEDEEIEECIEEDSEEIFQNSNIFYTGIENFDNTHDGLRINDLNLVLCADIEPEKAALDFRTALLNNSKNPITIHGRYDLCDSKDCETFSKLLETFRKRFQDFATIDSVIIYDLAQAVRGYLDKKDPFFTSLDVYFDIHDAVGPALALAMNSIQQVLKDFNKNIPVILFEDYSEDLGVKETVSAALSGLGYVLGKIEKYAIIKKENHAAAIDIVNHNSAKEWLSFSVIENPYIYFDFERQIKTSVVLQIDYNNLFNK